MVARDYTSTNLPTYPVAGGCAPLVETPLPIELQSGRLLVRKDLFNPNTMGVTNFEQMAYGDAAARGNAAQRNPV